MSSIWDGVQRNEPAPLPQSLQQLPPLAWDGARGLVVLQAGEIVYGSGLTRVTVSFASGCRVSLSDGVLFDPPPAVVVPAMPLFKGKLLKIGLIESGGKRCVKFFIDGLPDIVQEV